MVFSIIFFLLPSIYQVLLVQYNQYAIVASLGAMRSALYPLTHQWTLRLLLYLGYCK